MSSCHKCLPPNLSEFGTFSSGEAREAKWADLLNVFSSCVRWHTYSWSIPISTQTSVSIRYPYLIDSVHSFELHPDSLFLLVSLIQCSARLLPFLVQWSLWPLYNILWLAARLQILLKFTLFWLNFLLQPASRVTNQNAKRVNETAPQRPTPVPVQPYGQPKQKFQQSEIYADDQEPINNR